MTSLPWSATWVDVQDKRLELGAYGRLPALRPGLLLRVRWLGTGPLGHVGLSRGVVEEVLVGHVNGACGCCDCCELPGSGMVLAYRDLLPEMEGGVT